MTQPTPHTPRKACDDPTYTILIMHSAQSLQQILLCAHIVFLISQTEDGLDSLTLSSPPPPLLPRFHPPQASLLHQSRQCSTEDLFPNDMEMGTEDYSHRDTSGGKLMDITECPGEISGRESTDSDSHSASKLNGGLTVESQRLSSGPSPDLSEVSSVSQEDTAKPAATAAESSSSSEKGGDTHGAATESASTTTSVVTRAFKRRPSYQIATDDNKYMGLEDAESCLLGTSRRRRTSKRTMPGSKGEQNSEPIKRSTSSVENSSQAAIKLRKNLESVKSPRAVSTSVYSGSLYESALERMPSSTKDSAYFSLKSTTSPTNLEQLIDREVNTTPYPTPLIGCIPPSALKCFVDEKKAAESAGTSPVHRHSGTHALMLSTL